MTIFKLFKLIKLLYYCLTTCSRLLLFLRNGHRYYYIIIVLLADCFCSYVMIASPITQRVESVWLGCRKTRFHELVKTNWGGFCLLDDNHTLNADIKHDSLLLNDIYFGPLSYRKV